MSTYDRWLTTTPDDEEDEMIEQKMRRIKQQATNAGVDPDDLFDFADDN